MRKHMCNFSHVLPWCLCSVSLICRQRSFPPTSHSPTSTLLKYLLWLVHHTQVFYRTESLGVNASASEVNSAAM